MAVAQERAGGPAEAEADGVTGARGEAEPPFTERRQRQDSRVLGRTVRALLSSALGIEIWKVGGDAEGEGEGEGDGDGGRRGATGKGTWPGHARAAMEGKMERWQDAKMGNGGGGDGD